MSSLLALATEYRNAAISIIPLRLDGSKAPASHLLPQVCDCRTKKQTGTWIPYQQRIADTLELESWFRRSTGIGMVCGAISGGLEVLDFDNGSLFEPWYQQVKCIASRLPVVETPSGGWHVLFRCTEICGNSKIACDPKREQQTLIETRGQGGYVVAEGSPCKSHSTGLPYVQAFGPRLPMIPRITPSERRQLWAAARSFDKRDEDTKRKLIDKQTRKTFRVKRNNIHPVIAEFNRSNSWESILIPYGWTTSGNEYWTRPGKRSGCSAHVFVTDDGCELLTVFSSNAGPLSPGGRHQTWDKFRAWTELKHRGNSCAALTEARRKIEKC